MNNLVDTLIRLNLTFRKQAQERFQARAPSLAGSDHIGRTRVCARALAQVATFQLDPCVDTLLDFGHIERAVLDATPLWLRQKARLGRHDASMR
jgi:hypothetical protein